MTVRTMVEAINHTLAREMARDCGCEDGCPSCVGLPNLSPAIHSDPDLSRGYPMPNKQATVKLLELLCDVASDPLARSASEGAVASGL